MLTENLVNVSLRKLGPIRAELEATNVSLEELIDRYIVDHFEKYVKPVQDWKELRDDRQRPAMHFWFQGLQRDRHAAYGCERDNEFTITG